MLMVWLYVRRSWAPTAEKNDAWEKTIGVVGGREVNKDWAAKSSGEFVIPYGPWTECVVKTEALVSWVREMMVEIISWFGLGPKPSYAIPRVVGVLRWGASVKMER